jgi:hypothetical protein
MQTHRASSIEALGKKFSPFVYSIFFSVCEWLPAEWRHVVRASLLDIVDLARAPRCKSCHRLRDASAMSWRRIRNPGIYEWKGKKVRRHETPLSPIMWAYPGYVKARPVVWRSTIISASL